MRPDPGWFIVNVTKGSLDFWYAHNSVTGKSGPVRDTYNAAIKDIPKKERTKFLQLEMKKDK